MKLSERRPYLLGMAGILAIDQLSKALVVGRLPLYDAVTVIPGLFRIFHVQNFGAVWGLFSEHGGSWVSWLITGIACAALVTVAWLFFRTPASCRLERTAYTLIVGGASGNIVDRLRLGYVTDFLDVFVGAHHWPTFNVADSAICVGVGLLAISVWKGGKCTPS